jgi:drug/metabolite transporter (DMT)-like permease
MLTGQLSAILFTHSLVEHQRLPRLGLAHILGVSGRSWLTTLGAGTLVVVLGLVLAGLSAAIVWGAHNAFSQNLPNYRDDLQTFLLWLLLVGGLGLICLLAANGERTLAGRGQRRPRLDANPDCEQHRYHLSLVSGESDLSRGIAE